MVHAGPFPRQVWPVQRDCSILRVARRGLVLTVANLICMYAYHFNHTH
jgi:hypothetical protein